MVGGDGEGVVGEGEEDEGEDGEYEVRGGEEVTGGAAAEEDADGKMAAERLGARPSAARSDGSRASWSMQCSASSGLARMWEWVFLLWLSSCRMQSSRVWLLQVWGLLEL